MNDTTTLLALPAPGGHFDFAARVRSDAIEAAHDALTEAANVDPEDHAAVVRSQAGLAAALSWVLRTLDEDVDSRDRAAEVPNEVAAEDGVRSIGVPYQRGTEAA